MAIRAVYSPGSLSVSLAPGAAEASSTIPTVSGSGTYAYKLNPSERATFNQAKTEYGGETLTSGTTEIVAKAGDVIEIVKIESSKVTSVAYITVNSSDLKK